MAQVAVTVAVAAATEPDASTALSPAPLTHSPLRRTPTGPCPQHWQQPALMVPVYVARTSIMNSIYPLQKSILMVSARR